MLVQHLPYNIRSSTKWSANHEKSLSKDYPFVNIRDESPEDYVVRTYLQFLWLPESIMPLQLLVPSLHRVSAASSSTSHPLHTLLEPLLLTTRSVVNKYHHELPQILAHGGGAGEVEESMMWYVLGYEIQGQGNTSNEEVWRKNWLDRMERRETQVQILLYLLTLSLPGVPPPTAPSGARKRTIEGGQADSMPSLEEILEAFMDKLATWQLTNNLFAPSFTNSMVKDARDWAQRFCEEVVEPQFKSTWPDACAVLRSKLFPVPLFSDSSPQSSRATSPEARVAEIAPLYNTAPAVPRSGLHPGQGLGSRYASPVLNPALSCAGPVNVASSRHLARTRSRSLSVSLAQEKERAATSTVRHRKRVLDREVSMTRVFKNKPKARVSTDGTRRVALLSKDAVEVKQQTFNQEVTLVEATPVKPPALARLISVQLPGPDRIKPMRTSSAQLFGLELLPQPLADEEDIWELPSSPDVLLLQPSQDEDLATSGQLNNDSLVLVIDTPTKTHS